MKRELNVVAKESEEKGVDNKLTDSQIEDIKNTIEKNINEDEKKIRSYPSNNDDLEGESGLEPIQEEATVVTNINNGLQYTAKVDNIDESLAKILDIDVEDLINIPDDIKDIELRTEDIYRNAIESYDIKEEDVPKLIPLLDRYRNGEEIKYNDLPLEIKRVISRECASVGNFSKEAKNMFTDALISGIVRDSGIDKINLDMVNAISESFDMSEFADKMTTDTYANLSDKFNKGYVELSKKLKDKGEFEKAEKLDSISNAFKESYQLKEFKEFLKKVKIKKFDFDKIDRVCQEFNFKYENLRNFNIHDVRKLMPVYGRAFPEYKQSTRDALVIAFCRYCRNKNASNYVDHTFMSYFVLNSINLVVIKNHTGLIKEMNDNIKECLDILAERY